MLSLLGLAMRAGKVKSGSFLVEKALDARQARLILFADEEESGTVRALREKADRAGVPHLVYASQEALGRAIGKGDRSCAAVTDEGFARAIREAADKT